MAKILAFAGSNSSKSINYKLARYTTSLMKGHTIQLLNMANFPFPMYGEDYEKENGFSNSLIELKNDISKADAIVIAVNEHNSCPSAYFMNLIDWLSRLERTFIAEKKVFLLSTSPGKRGGIGAHKVANAILSRFGAKVIASFSLPSFNDNFDVQKGILEAELSKAHSAELDSFVSKI